MSERPWYKRYGADFVHGTLGLSLEEKGAYSLCLDLIYDRGGPIPDDPRWLAGVCGVSVRRWNALREALLKAGKLVARDGSLTNVRAEKEIENAAKTTRKLAENGSKGGNKRAKNAVEASENNDLAEAGLKHRARYQKPEAREEIEEANASSVDRAEGDLIEALPEPAAPPAKPVDRFGEFWGAYPQRDGANPKKPAADAFRRAVARGADPHSVIAGAKRLAAKHAGEKSKFVPQAMTWLNQQRWQDDETPGKGGSPPAIVTPGPVDDDRWRDRLQWARERDDWLPDRWGPPPGEPGTLVPDRLLTEPLRKMFATMKAQGRSTRRAG